MSEADPPNLGNNILDSPGNPRQYGDINGTTGAPIMMCPHCRWQVPERWKPLYRRHTEDGRELRVPEEALGQLSSAEQAEEFVVHWMRCPNSECARMLIMVVEHGFHPDFRNASESQSDSWYVVPKRPTLRLIDPSVKDPFRRDYLEAANILADSPRMSAVLSRRILGELLRIFAERSEFRLESQIDKFVEDPKYPTALKENLHHLRETANFCAHAQKEASTGEIIEVSREEAEWTLDVIDGLFDYFIVGPEKNRLRRAAIDEKIKKAGRKPIKGQP